MDHYLIKFKPTPKADVTIVGCLRFPAGTNYDQREAALVRWQAKARPHNPKLMEGETMYLDQVHVEDAEMS